jgi:hypothetical protein
MARTAVSLLLLCLGVSSQGCTHRAWYEGFQEQQRQQCYKTQNQADIQKCLDRVNSTTYDEYMKSR